LKEKQKQERKATKHGEKHEDDGDRQADTTTAESPATGGTAPAPTASVPAAPAVTPPTQPGVRDAKLEAIRARQAKLKADCDMRIAELTQKGKLGRKAEVEAECAKQMAAKEEREADREAALARKEAVEKAEDTKHDARLDAKRQTLNAEIEDIRRQEAALKQDCATRKADFEKQGKKGRVAQVDQQCDNKLAAFSKKRNNLEAQVENLTSKIAN
jgi:hypothetical protein